MGLFRTSEMRAFAGKSQKINFAELEKSPRRFTGTPVVLRGFVTWIQEYDTGTYFMLDVEEVKVMRNTSQRCKFLIGHPGPIDALPSDLLEAFGEITGEVSRDFEDGWGRDIVLPIVDAKFVNVYGKQKRF